MRLEGGVVAAAPLDEGDEVAVVLCVFFCDLVFELDGAGAVLCTLFCDVFFGFEELGALVCAPLCALLVSIRDLALLVGRVRVARGKRMFCCLTGCALSSKFAVL